MDCKALIVVPALRVAAGITLPPEDEKLGPPLL